MYKNNIPITVRYMTLLLCLLLGLFNFIACDDKLYTSEICLNNGHDIQCGEGEKVSIKNLECGSGSHACAPFINRTIFAVCDGQRYCGDLDLRSMVNVYCDNLVASARKIDVYYRCEAGVATSCRLNVCPENSPGLKCSNGGVIHVKKVFCKYEGVICSWETYATLYTLCEARSQCSAGALKTVLPVYCEEPEVSQRNVLVDYVCIKEKSVENVCSGTVRKLRPTHGLILSPGFTEHTASASSHCYWSIDPFPATRIKVIVHLAYHKGSMPNCRQKFLQIQFTGCNAGRIEKGSFCDIRKNNLEILSCGSVYISSLMSSNQPDFSDKFLISYQVTNDASTSTFGDSAVETCGSFMQPAPTSIPSIVSQEIVNTPDNTIETKSQTKDEPHVKFKRPIHILRKLKMMFLYIFFGLVIVALVISLVMVIISYKRMGNRGRFRRDASEKVVLVRKDDSPPRDKDETPMQTIRNTETASQNVASPTTDGGDVSPTHYDVLVPTKTPNTVIATIHLSSDEDKRLSAGSGFSSFRPSNRNSDVSSVNPYASYSSLNSNNSPQYYGRTPAPSTQQYVHSNGQKRFISPVRNSERQPLFRHSASPATSDDVDHFTINEDDYAIVKKPNVNKKQENVTDREPTYDNIQDKDVGRFRPTSGPYDKNRTSTEINFQFQPPSHFHDDDL